MSVCQRIYNKFFFADNFYKSIQPLLCLVFIDGTTPFLVVTNKRGQKMLQSSRWGFVTGLLSVIAFCYSSVYIIYHNESFISQFLKTDITSYSDKVHVLTGVIGCALVLISGFVHRSKLLRTIQLFAKIDHHFKQIGMLCNFTYILRTVLVMISFTFLCIFVSIAVSFSCWTRMNVFPSPPLIFMLVAEFVGVSFTIALYTFLTITVAINIRLLHKVLKNLGHQWDNRTMKSITHKQRSLQCLDSFSMYTIVTKDPSDIIQESMEIHHMICDAASTANKYFTYQLLTIISIAFLIIVFDAYYVLETLLGKSKRESKFKTVEFVTFFSCQMVLYLIAIISIVEGSNRAIKKSEKTGGIVHSLLNKTKSAEVKEKLQQFSLQLMHLKINFTAAGLFNIDRTLYFTISGALTTYLIILLQFTSSTSQPLTPEAQVANTTHHV